MKDQTAQHRWDNLSLKRSIYLRRAIDCSSLTIPSLIPDSDQNYAYGSEPYSRLNSLHQGAGARGLSGLSAKLLLALMPPSQPFFKLSLQPAAVRQLTEMSQDSQAEMSRADVALADIEQQVVKKLDKLKARTAIFELCKHLLCGGNGLIYVGPQEIKMFSLRSFCVSRDPEGNLSEIVVREEVAREFLPPGTNTKDGEDSTTPTDVYTWVRFKPEEDRVEWHQEHEGKKIPGSQGFSRMETCPWICCRLYRVAGESYGRSLVDDVIGDLQSLESLTRAIVEGSLIAAKAVALVNPNGVTRADAIARAENGAVVAGNPADVEFLTVAKQSDFSTALQTMQLIERRLNFAFLNNEAATRDAERVTAEEIRLMAEMLDSGLAGVYSLMSVELQLPLIKRVIFLMQQAGELDALPPEFVDVQITTGLDAIGRGNDKARLTNFMQVCAATIGPEQLLQYINASELIRRFAASDGIKTAALVKEPEELEAEQAQAQQIALEQQLANSAISNGATSPPIPVAPQGQPGVAGGGVPV